MVSKFGLFSGMNATPERLQSEPQLLHVGQSKCLGDDRLKRLGIAERVPLKASYQANGTKADQSEHGCTGGGDDSR